MIFVTVGTTHFDSLIAAVDRLIEEHVIDQPVICQIGAGQYTPKNCSWYRYKSSLAEDYRQADLIVTHGGFSVLECIWARRRIVAVPNTDLPGNHQRQFLAALHESVDFTWIEQVDELGQAIAKAMNMSPTSWTPPFLAGDLIDYLDGLISRAQA